MPFNENSWITLTLLSVVKNSSKSSGFAHAGSR